jgi:hypothetical protein
MTDALELERQRALLNEMGIDPTESEKLRATMLSADEAVHAKSEELVRARQKRGRKQDWDEWIDAKRRMGRVLHHSDVIRRLRSLVPDIMVGRGAVNGTIGLYQIRNTPVREVPDYKGPEKGYFSRPVYIGWMQEGEMPEYEIDLVNEVQVPIGQKRGWRTILLNMIVRWNYELIVVPMPGGVEIRENVDIWGRKIKQSRASIITEEQAIQAFGHPTQGATASAYRQQLYNFRNPKPEPLPKRY